MNATATAGLVEVEVRYDKGTQAELAVRAPQLAEQLSTIHITDQGSLDRANELILVGKQWVDSVDLIMDEVVKATHSAHKSAIKLSNDFKAPVLKPLNVLKAAVTAFIVRAQEEARRKQEAADAEQRRLNEAEARRVAAELKSLGASKAEIKEAKIEVKATPAPVVAPIVEVSSGQSIRTLYSAEVTSMGEFLKHVANDPYLLTMLSYSSAFKKAVESELRGEATKRKEQYSIPGTKLVKTASGAWRG